MDCIENAVSSSSSVIFILIAMETCLLSFYLAMDVLPDSSIPVFQHHDDTFNIFVQIFSKLGYYLVVGVLAMCACSLGIQSRVQPQGLLPSTPVH
jgi:hypothetical protein